MGLQQVAGTAVWCLIPSAGEHCVTRAVEAWEKTVPPLAGEEVGRLVG